MALSLGIMMKFTLIRLAKKPCSKRVVEQDTELKCRDIWREVVVDKRGKILTIKCLSHGHKSRGKEKQLANKL